MYTEAINSGKAMLPAMGRRKLTENNILDNKIRKWACQLMQKEPRTAYNIMSTVNKHRKTKLPYQTIQYHMRILESFGFIKFHHKEEIGELGELSRINKKEKYFFTTTERADKLLK